MLVPGLLVLYLGFDAGGYFAGTAGAAAAAIALLLAVRVLTAPRPFSGVGPFSVLALAGIAALAGLSLLSQVWSHAPARALLAFDLTVLYLGITALSGAVQQPAARQRTLIYGLLLALVAVCGAGLLSRLLPDVFPVPAQFDGQRLSYPISYWNSLGMLATLGIVLAVHVSSDRDVHWPARAISAGLVPAFGVTLLLTFSRGSIAALAVALVLYVVLSPRLALVGTALTTGPLAAVAAHVAYDATLLATSRYTAPSGVRQGHHVAAVALLCCIAAGAARAIAVLAERRLPAFSVPKWAPLVPAAVIVITGLAVLQSGWIDRQYHQFVNGSVVPTTAPARNRLTSESNNGRLELWRVAWRVFKQQPLRGNGAGTYVELWDQHRNVTETAQNAHSLYLETLAELGLLGGAALLCFWLGLLLGAARGLRSRVDRPVAALAVAGLVGWALHSAVDWDWQMPAVMIPVVSIAAAAAAGAAPTRRHAGGTAGGRRRLLGRTVVAACGVAVAVAPALVAVSQADLDSSVTAFDQHDCSAAVSSAQQAHQLVSFRPEPLEIIGYCAARDRNPAGAVAAVKQAIKRDPSDWEYRYALAIVTAAQGGDPLPALRDALRLDPREPLILSADRMFRNSRRTSWTRIASSLPLDVS